MEKENPAKDNFINQNIFLTASFTFAGGAIALLINLLLSKEVSFSIILLGLSLISFVLSFFFGLIFLIKRGNNSGQAQSGEKVPLHPDFYKAPYFIRGQFILIVIGTILFILYLTWLLFL